MKSGTKQSIVLFLTVVGIICFSAGWKNKKTVIAEEQIREAVAKSIPVLQISCNTFIVKKQCSSCHHGTLTSMAVELAKQKGIPVEDSFASNRRISGEGNLRFACNPNIVHDFLNVKMIIPYALMGMAAEKQPPDMQTDMAVAFMISEGNSDGSFPGEFLRVPLEDGQIHTTAIIIHAIQLYASPALKSKTDQMVVATRGWLEQEKPYSQQELTYQLLGMQWCGSRDEVKKEVVRKLLELQRPDGGWAQIPSLRSDAYATGQTLYALLESGIMKTTDDECQAAIHYLLKTQESNGCWFVEARSYIIQPFVNTNFPINDENQFISAAATSWASIALLRSLPDKIN